MEINKRRSNNHFIFSRISSHQHSFWRVQLPERHSVHHKFFFSYLCSNGRRLTHQQRSPWKHHAWNMWKQNHFASCIQEIPSILSWRLLKRLANSGSSPNPLFFSPATTSWFRLKSYFFLIRWWLLRTGPKEKLHRAWIKANPGLPWVLLCRMPA